MRRTVPPSAELQAKIDGLLGSGLVEDPQPLFFVALLAYGLS